MKIQAWGVLRQQDAYARAIFMHKQDARAAAKRWNNERGLTEPPYIVQAWTFKYDPMAEEPAWDQPPARPTKKPTTATTSATAK